MRREPERRRGAPQRSRPPPATAPRARARRARRAAPSRAPCGGRGLGVGHHHDRQPADGGADRARPEPAREPRGDRRRPPPRRRPGVALRGREPSGWSASAATTAASARQRPARGLGGGPDRLDGRRRILHSSRNSPLPAALAVARGLRLRLGEARRGLGRDLVDVGEDRLAEVVQRVGREAGARAGLDEAPPCPPRADAVGGEQRVQRAPGLVLAGAEPQVGVARAGIVGRLAHQQVHEAVERDLHAEAHDLAEAALHRARVAGHLGGDRGDDVVGEARERRAERVRCLWRERRLRGHCHEATRIGAAKCAVA